MRRVKLVGLAIGLYGLLLLALLVFWHVYDAGRVGSGGCGVRAN